MSSATAELSQRQIPFHWLWRRLDAVARLIEYHGSQLAKRKTLAIISIAGAAIILRLSLLPLVPVPTPMVQDEFSYLLAADTFAHGRLTNPPHPMSVYFETFHVNTQPTYMSKYPPAQGVVLAIGEILGNPWIGVLLSVAALCGLIVWMLQGWMPPKWALVGGFLAILRFGIVGYWVNSYWGGAVAGIGGTLIAGALPRIVRFQRTRDAVILALGAGILANSRPFEGMVFCGPVFVFLAVWLFRRKTPSWRTTMPRVILPICATGLLCVAFIVYYNWRLTGNALTSPYMVNDRAYVSVPMFNWQKPLPPMHYSNPQFEAFYNNFFEATWKSDHPTSLSGVLVEFKKDATSVVNFYLWPELCLPLLALPLALVNRKMCLLGLHVLICLGAFPLVLWFSPHYAAPMTGVMFVLVMQSFRYLRRWNIGAVPIGLAVSRILLIAAMLAVPSHTYWSFYLPSRAALEKKLNATPGRHLVIVQYSPLHNVHDEWVYNKADIDHAKIVWARDIPGVSLQPLLDYYRGRRVWLVQPDPREASILPAQGHPLRALSQEIPSRLDGPPLYSNGNTINDSK